MKVLVTGGAGFLGSHTVDRLVALGHDIRVIDDLSTGRLTNLDESISEIEFIEADIRDLSAASSACKGIDTIIHLAAVSSVEKTNNEVLMAHDLNMTGTLNILEAARICNARRVVFASSAAVYGGLQDGPVTEESIAEPISLYGWQKLSGEKYGQVYSQLHGIEFIALRYFNVYGVRQDPSSMYTGVISIFCDRAARNEDLQIHGDGNQTRDFVSVKDIAEINLQACEKDLEGFHMFNVATGVETSINDLAKIIIRLQQSDSSILHDDKRLGDIRKSSASSAHLRLTLDCQPTIRIDQGLREMLKVNDTTI